MVSFVKPSLLGTRKEFCNRFVNPITNGQHLDSTLADVRLMKRRAHVLHEMLAGCVQVPASLVLCCTCTQFICPYIRFIFNSNNNINNNNNSVYGAVIVAQSHYESSPGSYDECVTVPNGR